MLPRAEIFVDGTNFDIAANQLIGSSVDVPRFARELVKRLTPPHLLVKLRYCTAPHARQETGFARFQRGYFDALKRASSVELLLGRHEFRGHDRHGRSMYEEKETDVNVAVQMVAGAYENRYDTAVVISGDTDMVPAMKLVRSRGKRVIWCPFPEQEGADDLRKLADTTFPLTEQFLRTLKYLVVRR